MRFVKVVLIFASLIQFQMKSTCRRLEEKINLWVHLSPLWGWTVLYTPSFFLQYEIQLPFSVGICEWLSFVLFSWHIYTECLVCLQSHCRETISLWDMLLSIMSALYYMGYRMQQFTNGKKKTEILELCWLYMREQESIFLRGNKELPARFSSLPAS